VTAAAGQVAEIRIGGEAAVDDPDAAAEPPAAQVVLDLGDHRLVVGVARPHPHPDRDPLARDGEPDHDLRQIRAVVLRVAAQPQRRHPRIVSGLVGLGLEVRRGRVKEEQIDLEIQEIGAAEEDRLLQLRLRVGLDQQVERPVGLVVVHPVETGDRDVLGGPLGRRQLRAWCKRAIRDEREQHPLDIGRKPSPVKQPSERLRDPKPPPQRIQQPGAAKRPRADHLEPLGRLDPAAVFRAGVGVAADRAGQPPQPLDVELVLTAKVEQHLSARRATLPPVVRQLQIPHHRTVLPSPLRRPQIHAHNCRNNTGQHRRPNRITACPHFRTPAEPESA